MLLSLNYSPARAGDKGSHQQELMKARGTGGCSKLWRRTTQMVIAMKKHANQPEPSQQLSSMQIDYNYDPHGRTKKIISYS
jgi:hypothetical protein